ncbi:MAG TPA: tetraacyldisaccharide 4'-kinase, partial [Longimicrobiaceae bacterium]|nr:tetraacyldisaccharide 4'-kinase [Longimicrobiaceae bacterium]
GGADVAVVDDGFQHRALGRRLDVVLLAAESWRPPLRLLPRGPWREGLPALARADVLVVTRKSAPAEAAAEIARALAPHVGGRVVRCHLAPTVLAPLHGGTAEPVEGLRGREVLAVASLADPRPFARQLEAVGSGVEQLTFPDHHAFTAEDAVRIRQTAGERTVVMTRKDAVKLRPLLPDLPGLVLEQRVVVESGLALLEERLREASVPEAEE